MDDNADLMRRLPSLVCVTIAVATLVSIPAVHAAGPVGQPAVGAAAISPAGRCHGYADDGRGGQQWR